jgi:hypothetical protein
MSFTRLSYTAFANKSLKLLPLSFSFDSTHSFFLLLYLFCYTSILVASCPIHLAMGSENSPPAPATKVPLLTRFCSATGGRHRNIAFGAFCGDCGNQNGPKPLSITAVTDESPVKGLPIPSQVNGNKKVLAPTLSDSQRAHARSASRNALEYSLTGRRQKSLAEARASSSSGLNIGASAAAAAAKNGMGNKESVILSMWVTKYYMHNGRTIFESAEAIGSKSA